MAPDVLAECRGCEGDKAMSKPTFKQMEEFYRQVRTGRINSENYQEFLKTPDKLLEIIKARKKSKTKVVQPTFAELLAACKQDSIHKDFNEKNFPLEPIADDEADWEVYEHHFDARMRGQKAFKKLKKLGFRTLDGSRRAMEFIAKNPDIQLNHSLVATARWLGACSQWHTLAFGTVHLKERFLTLYGLDCVFNPYCGWLVLRKVNLAEKKVLDLVRGTVSVSVGNAEMLSQRQGIDQSDFIKAFRNLVKKGRIKFDSTGKRLVFVK